MTETDFDPEDAPERSLAAEIQPSQAMLEAELARNRAELARYRDLISALPSIYEDKFVYQRQMLSRELLRLGEEQQQLRLLVQHRLKAAARQRRLPPPSAPAVETRRRLRTGRRRTYWKLQSQRHMRRWRSRLRKVDLRSRMQSALHKLQVIEQQSHRQLRHWQLQRQRRRDRQRRLMMASTVPSPPAQVEQVQAQAEPLDSRPIAQLPQPLSPAVLTLEPSQHYHEAVTALDATFASSDISSAAETDSHQDSFQKALDALLASAPPAAYPRACDLYFHKFSLEASISAHSPQIDDADFGTYLCITPDTHSEQAKLLFSLVNWTDHSRDLSACTNYLASRWDLHPQDLQPCEDTWFRGRGHVVHFTLEEKDVSASAAAQIRNLCTGNASTGPTGPELTGGQ